MSVSHPTISNVGFLELTENSGHQELLTRYLNIATMGEGTPILFTTPDGIQKIDDTIGRDSLQTVVDDFNSTFLDRIEEICNEHLDVLFINTVEGTIRDLFRFARFNPSCATILWPHNALAWFERQFVWDQRSGLSTSLSYNLKNLLRPYILSQMDGLLLPFEQSAEYIRETYKPSQDIHVLPPTVFGVYNTSAPETSFGRGNGGVDTTRITIPGSINKRRDYERVLEVFRKEIFPEFGDSIELVLLGRPQGDYGDYIIDLAKTIESEGNAIRYFTEWIETAKYSREFNLTDIVLNPIIKDDAERKERWGLTWNSGVLFDILMFPSPLILPNSYTVPNEIRTSTMTYKGSDDLTKVISSILSDTQLCEKLKENAVTNARAFDRRSQFERFLNIIIKYTSKSP